MAESEHQDIEIVEPTVEFMRGHVSTLISEKRILEDRLEQVNSSIMYAQAIIKIKENNG